MLRHPNIRILKTGIRWSLIAIETPNIFFYLKQKLPVLYIRYQLKYYMNQINVFHFNFPITKYSNVTMATHLLNVVHPLLDRLEGGSIGYVKTNDNSLETDISCDLYGLQLLHRIHQEPMNCHRYYVNYSKVYQGCLGKANETF